MFLCGRVENVLFEEDQGQQFKEEPRFLAEEGKWISPSYMVL